MNPIDRYQSDIASGKTSRDLAQLQVLGKLSELQEEINGLPASSPAWWQRTLNSLSARDPRRHGASLLVAARASRCAVHAGDETSAARQFSLDEALSRQLTLGANAMLNAYAESRPRCK